MHFPLHTFPQNIYFRVRNAFWLEGFNKIYFQFEKHISLSYAIYHIYLAFILSIFWSEKNTVLLHESKLKYHYEAHYVSSLIKECC